MKNYKTKLTKTDIKNVLMCTEDECGNPIKIDDLDFEIVKQKLSRLEIQQKMFNTLYKERV